MKKTLLLSILFTLSINIYSQRTMYIYSGGSVAQSMSVSAIDSIKFVENHTPPPQHNDSNDKVYLGIIAFDRFIRPFPITNDLEASKEFILSQTNTVDATVVCYAASKGAMMFDVETLPDFDKIFMLTFTDGTDNYSQQLWLDEGRDIPNTQNARYDTASADIKAHDRLSSYAIGFGDDVGFKVYMQTLVSGGGEYQNAKTSSDLQPVFQGIAQSILASAKNVVITTQPGKYNATLGYKYIRLLFYTEEGHTDTIICQLSGENSTGYTLEILKAGNYAQFDAPATGEYNADRYKAVIPLNNLKFVYGDEELLFSIRVEVSLDNMLYYYDVEDATSEEAVSKRIGVVMVLDCSSSMGDAFEPMKEAAIDFIEILETMKNDSTGTIVPPVGGGTYTYTANDISFNMKSVAGGSFTMGCTAEQGSDCWDDESPSHNVTLSDFSIGETEVTQELWSAVMGSNPSYFTSSGVTAPVEQVSWNDMVGTSSSSVGYTVNGVTYYQNGFCYKLSALVGGGKQFRLPIEAEWEYAARGGSAAESQTKYSGSNTVGNVAWYYDNSSSKTHEVKGKQSNALGLYDMSGNVWEWCSDWYGNYSSSAQTNPAGSISGSFRVLRGGRWDNGAGVWPRV
ncbi:MAG: SUMF1/EgtB/PvdO family nonheme iron enzyme [Bacteroidales bacterium]|jgi:formylglycine-generating enzyme required for sulfatase activity|nr:SUMF1/EgtB/PvdO family nonheme iron enzyme [Bacteroidales bacterium]